MFQHSVRVPSSTQKRLITFTGKASIVSDFSEWQSDEDRIKITLRSKCLKSAVQKSFIKASPIKTKSISINILYDILYTMASNGKPFTGLL
jgi:hypothetical protein